MKTLNVVLLFAFIFIMSCSKDEILSPTVNSESKTIQDTLTELPLDTIPGEMTSRAVSYPSTSYVCLPGINVPQTPPTSSIYSNGITYYGGPFQSSVSSITGNTITFKLIRTDGGKFPVGSILKIKRGSVGGTVVATLVTTILSSTFTLNVSEVNTWNLPGGSQSNPNNFNKYYATWYNPASNLNFYTKRILIVAVPTGWGELLATLNNVNVYSNGWGGFSATDSLLDTYGQKFQCVHYIKRYYSTVYNKNIGNGNASVYWFYYLSHNLTQRIYNGNGIPQQGDIICFSSTSGSYHVGIVKGVVSGKLRVYQENVGQTLINGNYCSGYKDFTFSSNQNGYNVSASVLGSSWSTLGWVR